MLSLFYQDREAMTAEREGKRINLVLSSLASPNLSTSSFSSPGASTGTDSPFTDLRVTPIKSAFSSGSQLTNTKGTTGSDLAPAPVPAPGIKGPGSVPPAPPATMSATATLNSIFGLGPVEGESTGSGIGSNVVPSVVPASGGTEGQSDSERESEADAAYLKLLSGGNDDDDEDDDEEDEGGASGSGSKKQNGTVGNSSSNQNNGNISSNSNDNGDSYKSGIDNEFNATMDSMTEIDIQTPQHVQRIKDIPSVSTELN